MEWEFQLQNQTKSQILSNDCREILQFHQEVAQKNWKFHWISAEKKMSSNDWK